MDEGSLLQQTSVEEQANLSRSSKNVKLRDGSCEKSSGDGVGDLLTMQMMAIRGGQHSGMP